MKNEGLKTTGCPSMEELKNTQSFPKEKDYRRGGIAVIECIEEIPCNPCEMSCPRGAIQIGKPITNLPVIDFEKCTGCGICITACPGLAIYVKNLQYSEEEALISFPYEYVPLPKTEDSVMLVGRKGEEICWGTVVKVNISKANHQTPVISVRYPKTYFEEVVNMKRSVGW